MGKAYLKNSALYTEISRCLICGPPVNNLREARASGSALGSPIKRHMSFGVRLEYRISEGSKEKEIELPIKRRLEISVKGVIPVRDNPFLCLVLRARVPSIDELVLSEVQGEQAHPHIPIMEADTPIFYC